MRQRISITDEGAAGGGPGRPAAAGQGGRAGAVGIRDDRGAGRRERRADAGPPRPSQRLLRPHPGHPAASWSCGCHRIGKVGSRPSCSNATNAPRRHSWRRWPRCTCKACRPARSRRSPRSSAGIASRPARAPLRADLGRRRRAARLRELRWLYDRRDLAAWLAKCQGSYPKLCGWVEEHIEETLTF
jgi:hypothetical protein